MKEIPLTQGKVALVDDQDFEWLNQWKWHARITKRGYVSACREVGNSQDPATRQIITMAKEICKNRGCRPTKLIDHKDGNSLNNQFENLRPTDYTGNNRNVRKRAGTSSLFKGVCWCHGKWQAMLQPENKRLYLGRFCDEIEAARVYDEAAKKYFGEFAQLNFP